MYTVRIWVICSIKSEEECETDWKVENHGAHDMGNAKISDRIPFVVRVVEKPKFPADINIIEIVFDVLLFWRTHEIDVVLYVNHSSCQLKFVIVIWELKLFPPMNESLMKKTGASIFID